MQSVVVIGAGHCGGQLVARLRTGGFQGRIRLIGREVHVPYQRPPLSKKYMAGEIDVEGVYLRSPGFYEDHEIELMLGRRVDSIDRAARGIFLEDGERIEYDDLVLATGSRVRKLEIAGSDLEGVFYLRTISDADGIRTRIKKGARVAVIGGGYIGLEVASVAARAGCSVTILEQAAGLIGRVVCPETADFYRAAHEAAGVSVMTGVQVRAIEGNRRVERVVLQGGHAVEAELVLIGIGIVPETTIAEAAGLEVENGIVVDEHGRTGDERIWAAGDCTLHWSELYGRRVRLESVHNAMAQAKVVAENLMGKKTVYNEVPWFWSDQYDLKLQIAGLSQGYDRTVLRGSPQDGQFSVCYLRDGILIAVDSVNAKTDHFAARKLIAKSPRVVPERLADTEIQLD